VVLIRRGPFTGKLAVVVEIVDHKRVRFFRDWEPNTGIAEWRIFKGCDIDLKRR
jgi:hypothetical protein